MEFYSVESIWISGLVFEFLFLCIWAFRSKSSLTWFQPPIFYGIIILYYTLGGTIFFTLQDSFFDRGINFRSSILLGLKGAFISYSSFLIAYFTTFKKLKKIRYTSLNPLLALKLGRFFNYLGLFLFFLVVGPSLIYMLNPLDVDKELVAEGIESALGGYGGILGPFANYGSLAINMLIPGTLLIAAFYFKTKRRLIELISWFFITFSIYTTLGFRYRILLLFLGIFNIRIISKNLKVNFFKFAFILLLIILIMGIIGETRQYGGGLNFEDTEFGILSAFAGAFNEAKILFSTGKLIEIVPEKISFIGIKPILNTITLPIPSFFFENKNSFDYLQKALSLVYGSKTRSLGASFLNYGEYYFMGGWIGVFLCSAIIGSLYKFLWKWFISRKDEILAQVIYTTSLIYAYVLISRGYLPQATMIYFFTVVPLIFYYYKLSKKLNN